MRTVGTLVLRPTRPALNQQVLDTVAPVIVVLGILLATVGHYGTNGSKRLDSLGIAMVLMANLPVILRRRFPVGVMAVCCVGETAFVMAGYGQVLNSYGLLIAIYTVAASRPRRVSVWAAVVAAGVLTYDAVLGRLGSTWLLIILSAIFSGSAWSLGEVRRMLTDSNTQLAMLTRQLEADREARARRAVIEERVRIARELHDIVAHHMSVISIQGGLAHYVLTSDPPTAATALRTITMAAAEALEEMRRLLGLLRLDSDPDGDSDQPFTVTPGLAQLDQLLDRMSAAGIQVELNVSGPVRQLPSGVELCAYRVVQESLTNVLKHAHAERAAVEVCYGETNLVVRVRDDGPGDPAMPDQKTPGNGLLGMRERARLYGGALTARVRPEGGFEVMLTLPVAAGTDPAEPQRE